MIIYVIGTRAQLIKMAPVIRLTEQRQYDFVVIFTGQHVATMDLLLKDFGISSKPINAVSSREVTGIIQSVFWFLSAFIGTLRLLVRHRDKTSASGNIVVVHGDTLSTLLGALAGKLLMMRVAHVESGLRSFNLFHPFPEEITRLLTFRLMDIAFCPGSWALGNLSKYRCSKIDTINNTLLDGVQLVIDHDMNAGADSKYVVCSVHRFENIFDRGKLTLIVELISRISTNYRVLFVLHPATRKRLHAYCLYDDLNHLPNVEFRDRMTYGRFINLIAHAEFVVTDGGSNQEELSYMGVPTLLLRKATEREEGLGSTVCLSGYQADLIDAFLENPARYRKESQLKDVQSSSPSEIIINALVDI